MVEGILGKISGNLIISAFIPSFGFVLLASFIFEPIIPKQIAKNLAFGFDQPTRGVLTLLALTLILGFVLYGLTIFNYKLVEGYYLWGRIRFIRRRRQRAALKLQRKIAVVRALQEAVKGDEKKLDLLGAQRYRLVAQYDQRYPESIYATMPTRFGNILRASETYPSSRYGIDAVTMWPRLINTIPTSFQSRLHESNNSLAFVVNCFALSLLLALLCFIAAGFQLLVWQYSLSEYQSLDAALRQDLLTRSTYFDHDAIARPVYLMIVSITPYMQKVYAERSLIYLICGSGSLLVAVGFYYVALPTATTYGNMIRAAYDLFRFNLLKELRQDMPESLSEEKQTWRVLSEFFAVGQRMGTKPIDIYYTHHDQSTETD
jgi:hypothetical protein